MRLDLAEPFVSLTRKNVMDALICDKNPISAEVEKITQLYIKKFQLQIEQTGITPQTIALGVPRCPIEEVAMELATMQIRERLDSLKGLPQEI